MTTYRTRVSFRSLVEDVAAVLDRRATVVTRGGSRTAPDPLIRIQPSGGRGEWDGRLWNEHVAPAVAELAAGWPRGGPAEGWSRGAGGAALERVVRAALEASPWAGRVDYGSEAGAGRPGA